ncbi:MAG TPA: ParB/RepB/Spo0J family partition protein [Nitrospiria bacterium]|nr:ParB/RepB/Spo0J family partition protein [Nitrospiria bacterium]
MQKKALGRGLDALFDRSLPVGEPGAVSTGRFLDLDIRRIIPNRYQPRKTFREQDLQELTASVKERGILQPVLVRTTEGGQYELIAGERRWRAAKLAGLEKIPAMIQQASDPDAVELALIENLQRQDLNPIETAKAYHRLVDEFRLTQEEVAKRVGKDRSSIANTLRLLNLPPEIQEALASDRLTVGHAKVLLSLTGLQAQLRMARRILQKGLSVRAAELAAKRAPARDRSGPAGIRTALTEAEERLIRYLGTRVRITVTNGGGQVAIHYHNPTDLDRLLDLILK